MLILNLQHLLLPVTPAVHQEGAFPMYRVHLAFPDLLRVLTFSLSQDRVVNAAPFNNTQLLHEM